MSGVLALPSTACSIERQASVTTDADGVPTRTATTATTTCQAQPYRATPEEVAAGQVYAEGRFRVWLPAGTEVDSSSVWVFNGGRYPVLGEPLRWDAGIGLDHVEIVAGRRQ